MTCADLIHTTRTRNRIGGLRPDDNRSSRKRHPLFPIPPAADIVPRRKLAAERIPAHQSVKPAAGTMNPDTSSYTPDRLRSMFLLVSLVALIVTSTWTPASAAIDLLLLFFYTAVFCMAGYLIGARKSWLMSYIGLAIPFAALRIGAHVHEGSTGLMVITEVLTLTLFSSFILLVFRFSLFEPGTTRIDRIIAGICGYLILGFLGANLYSLHELLRPGGFIDGNGLPFDGGEGGFLYFSLITISTTGYGDILPVTPFARMLASMQAVIGTLYLAVFISTLVSGVGGGRTGAQANPAEPQ